MARGAERWLAAAALLLAVTAAVGCRFEKRITGSVTDFATGQPVSGATVSALQSGWGFSNGQLVWDKNYTTAVTTAADGTFELRYRVGDSVRLLASAPGYQPFRHHYSSDASVALRLKAVMADYRRLPNGFLRLGEREDGSRYGWDFATSRLTTDPDAADLFPVSVAADSRGPLTVRAAGRGGIRFVARAELGVDGQFLTYTDTAPSDGYVDSVTLDFKGEGGIYFVRTRDGRHYAKVEFTPTSFFMDASPGVRRDLSLRYVYNPAGGVDLRFQELQAGR